MDYRGIAVRVRDLSTVKRRLLIGLLLLLMVVVAWWSLNSPTPDLPIALWWPAAAIGAAAALASRGRRIIVVLLIVAMTVGLNLEIGRPVDLSLGYGIANGLESWVIAWMLSRKRPFARMVTLPEVGWFLVCAAAGGAVIALIGGASAAMFVGAELFTIVSSLFTSHVSATFAIVPLFLVPLTVPFRVPLWELFAQTIALIVLTVIVFAPAAALGLTFFIITTLMWGGFRLPPIVPAIQTILLAFVATLGTSIDLGPFAELVDHDQRAAVIALQLFVMTHAAAGVFVSGQAHDWNATTEALAARERDAARVVEELRTLNQQKDDFISAVSHELRTPVTSIIGFSEELVDSPDPDVSQAGQVIHRNAHRLADVIEDVLELSRISTQKLSTRGPQRLDVARLLRDCVEDTLGIVPTSRQVRVEIIGAEHPVMISVVAQDLVRVYSNLLSNAIKFSPQGGLVTVTLSEHPDEVTVTIADEGPGVPLDEQEAVWERFYRVQSARHHGVPGTGLGLPIVRNLLATRLGGKATLSSDGQHGTTVTVTVPRYSPVSSVAPTA